MCGRYASYRTAADLAEAYEVDAITEEALAVTPSYNVAPTQPVRIVLDRAANETDDGRREMHAARWGLVPAWAKDVRIGYKMINARRESLDDRPAFRASLRRRRCVVPADGYYEWQRAGGTSRPYYVHDRGDGLLALAGLYAFWRNPERAEDDPHRWVLSTAVITTAATGALARLHDRVPVVLGPDQVDRWLDPAVTSSREALGRLEAPPPGLRFHAVSQRVNGTIDDDPGLIEPA